MAGNSKNKKASAAREQRLAGLVALTSDIYWEQDAQYRFTHFSGGPPQMVKSMRRGWLGKRRWDKKFVNMHASDWAAHRKLLEERRPFRDLVLALVEGAPVQWFSVSGEPVFGATGRFLGYRGLGKNITAQKREQALSALEHSVTRALAAAETTAAGIHAVLRAICELEAWPVGRYFVADEAAGVLRFAAAWSSDTAAARAFVAKSQAMVYRPGQGLSGEVWRTGEAIWVADVRKDARAGGSARSAGSRGLRGGALVIPVKIRSATLGVMSFSRGERREPDALLLRSLNAIGEQIGQFLWRKQAETALAQSEIHFRQTFELAASGIAHVSLDGHFLRVNRRLCAILGYGQSQLVGRTVKDISHPEDRDVTDAGRARLHAREVDSTNFEKRYLRQDGSTVWVNLTVALARNTEGEPQYEIAIIEDISERKEAEAKLRRFRAGLDGAADMMFLVDPRDATLLDFNDAVCRILGYSREELLGQPATLVRSDRAAADLVADYRRFRDMPERGETVRIFYRHRNGEMVPVETMRRLIETPEGPIVVINSRDLREQRAAERALRESEERFRSLTKLSTDWYWEQDPEFRFTKFEGGAGDKRYDPSAIVLGKRVWQITRLDLATADWHAHRAALERHEPFRDFEYAYRDEHGNRFYVSASGEPMFDEDGRFKGYRGTARDMTRRRRDEEALRRFRAAMDMSVDAIFLTDRATMRFVDANKAACNVLGVKRADLMDMGPERVFRVPRAEIEQAFDEVIAKGFSGVRVERSYVAADGSERWTELHRRALRADEGWIIVTIARDITERKTAEQRRARHTRRQERIARFGHEALAQRDPHELIAAAVQNVLEALGAEGVAYFEPGSRAGEVVLRALLGTALAAGQGALLQLAAENPLARVLASGKHTCVTGAETGLDWAGALGSVALMPVRGQRGTRAVLAIGQRAHDGFGGEALNFMEAIATILSTALLRIDSESQLAYLAQFDSLTGLPNRALLTDRFGQAIAQAVRRGTTVGVLFVDLDEFKLVNDTLGHAAGDELLKAAAARLQSTVRAGDTVARIAGDEFALLLADLASADQAAIVAQKIVSALGEPFTVRGRDVLVTASVGIAAYPADGQDAEALLAAADAAMYRAKQAGRNSYQFFTPDLNVRMRARSQMTAELRRALERGEFELYYQPKYDLQSRAICGVEALLRWKHPSRGLISPAEFIPLLEESGLIVAVGEWVLGDACAALGARIADGLARHSVAVNLSARQFRQQDLATRLTSIVAAAGVEPGLVELEITESQLMQDPEHAVRVLHALRAAGIGLAIDDFGTGYSSLSYLTRFPLSALKIDRSFVARALDDKAAAAIVRAIIDLARTLGFTVVAEGIETEAQAAFLRGLRCDQGQGFLFARPMPEAELRRLLEAPTALAGTKRSGVSQLLGRTRR